MVDSVKAIPEGVPVVMPMLVCRDASAAIDFCKSTFDAVELVRRPGPDGKVAHAALTIGGAMIMIEAEWPTLASRATQPDGSSPVVIYLYVEDVDKVIEWAVAAGASVPDASPTFHSTGCKRKAPFVRCVTPRFFPAGRKFKGCRGISADMGI